MRGEIAFEPALRERVALLQGPARRRRRRDHRRAHHPDAGRAATLVRTMRARRRPIPAWSQAASRSSPARSRPGSASTSTAPTSSSSTARRSPASVEEPILGREAKLATLIELRERLGLARSRDAGGRRRRQRSRHARRGRPRRRLPGQARRRRGRPCPDRPRRPDRAALRAGLCEPRRFVARPQSSAAERESEKGGSEPPLFRSRAEPETLTRSTPPRSAPRPGRSRRGAAPTCGPPSSAHRSAWSRRPGSTTGSWPTSTMTSPAWMRLSAAAEFGSTRVTTTPFSSSLRL